MLRVLRAVHAFETSTRPVRGNRLMYAGREPTSVRRALGRDDACAPPCSAELSRSTASPHETREGTAAGGGANMLRARAPAMAARMTRDELSHTMPRSAHPTFPSRRLAEDID